MDRKQHLRSLVNDRGFGLEISPSHSPVFPKALGYNVEIADQYTKAELLQKYRELGVATDAIEEVDYPLQGRSLDEAIAPANQYDFIFSSHVIEHVPDIVSHLRSCERLLKPGGILALAVPDKRYTFDLLQQTSTTGQALEAYHRRRVRHSPAAVYDFIANYMNLDAAGTWSRGSVGSPALIHDIEGAYALLVDSLPEAGGYHDVHGWYFTPSSWRLILRDLKHLGLVQFEEGSMHVVDALEFYVTLSIDAPGHGLSRLDLHKEMVREMVEAGAAILPIAAQPPERKPMAQSQKGYGTLRRWWNARVG